MPAFLSRPSRVAFRRLLALVSVVLAAVSAKADIQVIIDLMPTTGDHRISPYIYGINDPLPGIAFNLRRQGGNRMTGYNWENNASNAGADYFHQSDDYLTWKDGITGAPANVPGLVVTRFQDQVVAAGIPYSIATLPMAGYVAADKNGRLTAADAAPSSRWAAVANTKPSAFAAAPDLTDGKVYTDELLNFLVARYGPASSATGIKAYSLDNEPDLWSDGQTASGAVVLENNGTHPLLHPAKPLATELIARSVDLAKTVKRIDPSAEVVGFASYGFGGYQSFQSATDWPAEKAKGDYRWFVDYYLDKMREASATAGTRLLDVLDLHNYSEARGGGLRINATSDFTNVDANKARLQAPRSFWDPTYVEDSWIGQWNRSFLPWLPNIQQSIDTYYPGTKLAIAEYSFGGESHVSGGIAQADILGIFGRHGVYAAALWPLGDTGHAYAAAAFNLYLNYDGAGSQFGDRWVNAYILQNGVRDPAVASVYASNDPVHPGRLHVILLNKSYYSPTTFDLLILEASYSKARVFAFDATSPAITERAAVPSFAHNRFSYTLPALSAAHFVLEQLSDPTLVGQPPATLSLAVGQTLTLTVEATGEELSYQWQRDDADIPGATRATLTISNAALTDTGNYRCIVSNPGSLTFSDATAVTVSAAPFTAQPRSLSVTHGADATFSAAVEAGAVLQWQRNGRDLPGQNAATLALAGVQPASAGVYSANATNASGTFPSAFALLGVSTWQKVAGDAQEVDSDIHHPNGNIYDQVLLTGAAASVTTNEAQVVRTSFIDLDDDIVQVEFSGPGTLSIVLDDASGPALPTRYNQNVSYMKGHAGIVITGATQASHLSIFSVGKITAVNQGLFKPDVAYDGIADIAYIAIASANGRFGGLRAANAHCFAHQGITGIYAPNVAFTGPVRISDITAFDQATPVLMLGDTNATLIDAMLVAGGDCFQDNGRPIQVRLSSLPNGILLDAGADSHGNALPSQPNRGVFKDNAQDVSDIARQRGVIIN